MKKPSQIWRITRGERGDYESPSFDTKEERDAAGKEWAEKDGENVLLMLWSAEHPQDELNQGWACDGVVYAPGQEPEPDARERVAASWLNPGQHVSVWGFPTVDPSTGDSKFVDGKVAEIATLDGYLSTRVTMMSGTVVFCVPTAIARINPIHKIDLSIVNSYESGDDEVTTHTAVEVFAPPPGDDDTALGDWAQEELFDYTGTGRYTGKSWYDVTITKFDARPDLVGRTFELGDY